jgi:TrmH family RNA methyltransferase
MRVVLVRSRYPGNVGAAIRVAGNFGVPELVLVQPAFPFDEDEDLLRMAMGGLEVVRVTTAATLREAVGDANLVLATTSPRSRELRRVLTPPQARELVAERAPRLLAVVFGPERGGLSREELRLCHARVTVPTNPGFAVLNLAQAVAVIVSRLCEGVQELAEPPDAMDRPASLAELESGIRHIQEALLASGALDPQNPARIVDQVRRWLGRTAPTRRELALLHALAAHVAYLTRPRART